MNGNQTKLSLNPIPEMAKTKHKIQKSVKINN